MDVDTHAGAAAARIAAAIGEPARARMLYCLMDNHARTSTELAVVACVSPSTASVHLNRLKTEGLVKVQVQGKHRYYSVNGGDVTSVLEGLSVLAGGSRDNFVPNTPATCAPREPVMTIWPERWASYCTTGCAPTDGSTQVLATLRAPVYRVLRRWAPM